MSELFKDKPARYKEPNNRWITDNMKNITKSEKNVLKVLHTHRNGDELLFLHSEIEKYKESELGSESRTVILEPHDIPRPRSEDLLVYKF